VLKKAIALEFDLIILDIMLPGRNGLDICQEMRLHDVSTPVLLLTARAEVADKIVGLKIGTDDYVTKPFDMKELMARIEAMLRRGPAKAGAPILRAGPLRVDTRSIAVTRLGIPVYLSIREFRLLVFFIEHAGLTLSRNKILQEVWDYDIGAVSRTVDMHVVSLRQKLERDPKRPELILTMPRVGYKFCD
jgi:DNA-binding response OmpR family regulator